MQTGISTQSAAIVAASFPSLIGRRQQFEEAMAGQMARRGPFDPARDRHRVTATAIADMLLDHAGSMTEDGGIAVIPHHGQRHHRMAIAGEHYAAFGDGLAPVLKDILHAEATPEFVAAWGDAYWAIARIVMGRPIRAAA
jgi:nitric oxide dioxygenase